MEGSLIQTLLVVLTGPFCNREVYIDVWFTEKLKKLTDFCMEKLLAHRYSSNEPEMSSRENEGSKKLYCICWYPEYGKMVRCDHPECEYE